MDRRTFLLTSAAATASGPLFAAAGEAYSPGLVKKMLSEGKTVFIDFYTDWCTTCKRQERVIGALRSENPEYEAINFVAINFDKYGREELSRELGIPRRSTLVVLTPNGEIGRIVAGTSTADIKALMDKALNAATA
ncbi:thioredoxin domain-containing protein [Rhodobacteraceae bacterium]|nr:thioredoxin domain-containing protein [Paracoccaceae bacterium]